MDQVQFFLGPSLLYLSLWMSSASSAWCSFGMLHHHFMLWQLYQCSGDFRQHVSLVLFSIGNQEQRWNQTKRTERTCHCRSQTHQSMRLLANLKTNVTFPLSVGKMVVPWSDRSVKSRLFKVWDCGSSLRQEKKDTPSPSLTLLAWFLSAYEIMSMMHDPMDIQQLT